MFIDKIHLQFIFTNMKKKILIFIILFTACSPFIHVVPDDAISNFTQFHEGNIINANKKLRIDGYYEGLFKNEQLFNYRIIFFDDGSAAFNFHESFLISKFQLRNNTACGTYILNNNIINAQIICIYGSGDYYCLEKKFKILNDTTLCLIQTKDLVDKTVIMNDSTKDDYLKPLHFIKLEQKPDSIFWLKKKRWFWCDKEKYKEYMRKKI